jgi:DNA-binding Lrp family transcriptional regulator
MNAMVKLNKIDELVVSALKSAGKELTLAEIAEKTGETEKKIFKSLRKLFENEIINTQNRKYRLLNLDKLKPKEEDQTD